MVDTERVKLPGGLMDHERCLLARRRAGMRLVDLSPEVGVSLHWLCLMERGVAPVKTLLDYWQRQR